MNIVLSRKLSVRTYEARFEYLEFSKEDDNQINKSILELCRDLGPCTLKDINCHLFGYGENSPVSLRIITNLVEEGLIKKKRISTDNFNSKGIIRYLINLLMEDPEITAEEKYFLSITGKIALRKGLFPVRKNKRYGITLTDEPDFPSRVIDFFPINNIPYRKEDSTSLKSDNTYIDTLIQKSTLINQITPKQSEFVLLKREDEPILIQNPSQYFLEIEYNIPGCGSAFIRKNDVKTKITDIRIPSWEELFAEIKKKHPNVILKENALALYASYEDTTAEERKKGKKELNISLNHSFFTNHQKSSDFLIIGHVDIIPIDKKELILWAKDAALRSIREYISPDDLLSVFIKNLNELSRKKVVIKKERQIKYISNLAQTLQRNRDEFPDQFWFVHATQYLTCDTEKS